MTVKVSVVVAVYNPGDNIDTLLASLAAQSLPAEEVEVVFVDDGSSDGTPDRLRAFAARRPKVIVTSIPNSGWPGRPRNIGMDLATGDYVFFADHDDEIFPEALERMHDLATANGSDIVYGKLVTTGSPTPFWPLARRTIGNADLVADNLLLNRMVHKLFRRQFLVDNGIRFAEGPVRLEDHLFMGQAMPLAKVISVLADYPCYRWVVRHDGTNNSTDQVDFPGYWDYLGTSMDLFTERAGPGRANDAALAWAGQRMLLHAQHTRYLPLDDEAREAMLSPLYDLVSARLPERVDPLVPVLKRLRLQSLRRRDREGFDRVSELTATLAPTFVLDQVTWQGGVLHLVASCELLKVSGEPVVVHRAGQRLVMPVGGDPEPAASARALLSEDEGTLELTVRHRTSGVEWPLAGTQLPATTTLADGVGLVVTWQGDVDVWEGAFGAALEDGIWDVLARMQFLGESRTLRVPLAADSSVPDRAATKAGRRAVAYRTAPSTLAIKIGRVAAVAASPRVVEASWQGDLLLLRFEPPVSEPALVVARERGGQDGSRAPVSDSATAVRIGTVERGTIIDFSLLTGTGDASKERRLGFALTEVPQRPGYVVYETAHGSLSVRSVPLPPASGTPRPPSDRPSMVARVRSGLRRLRS